jgi:hypothetical protein
MKGQKIWVPLDPSFKQHEKIEGLDLSSIIRDNFSSAIVDNTGINASSTNWATFTEVPSNKKQISFEQAIKNASNYLSKNSSEILSKTVMNTELVFIYNPSNDAYDPTWLFDMGGNVKIEVNCFNGEVVVKD